MITINGNQYGACARQAEPESTKFFTLLASLCKKCRINADYCRLSERSVNAIPGSIRNPGLVKFSPSCSLPGTCRDKLRWHNVSLQGCCSLDL